MVIASSHCEGGTRKHLKILRRVIGARARDACMTDEEVSSSSNVLRPLSMVNRHVVLTLMLGKRGSYIFRITSTKGWVN